jgi:hypothetical protein
MRPGNPPPKHIKVTDGIYIGNLTAASDTGFLRTYNINAVVNLTGKALVDVYGRQLDTLPPNVVVLDFLLPSQELMDTEIPKTCNKLDAIMTDIRSLRVNHRNILVQCNDGKNKSMLVIGYYLIVDHERPYDKVIDDLEILYFTDQQKAIEIRDRQQRDADPEIIEGLLLGMSADARKQLEVDRLERRELRGLTMLTFRKLLRLKGGAKK